MHRLCKRHSAIAEGCQRNTIKIKYGENEILVKMKYGKIGIQ
jgi:hypothetical protein